MKIRLYNNLVLPDGSRSAAGGFTVKEMTVKKILFLLAFVIVILFTVSSAMAYTSLSFLDSVSLPGVILLLAAGLTRFLAYAQRREE